MVVSPKSALFRPIQVGTMHLSTRIALAPMTRLRGNEQHEVHDLHVEYYTQRAHTPGTLLITEATSVDEKSGFYAGSPGIYTDAQVAAWKKVVDAVHAKGSFIYLQLWAQGRTADPTIMGAVGADVVSASDVPLAEDRPAPRPLTVEEIKENVRWFARAAKRFVEEAGGDGIEIHGANGYLLDQFLQTNSNKRTDSYGGSVENRARFPLEVVDAVVASIGAERTGVRFSPFSTFQGMRMPSTADIKETFGYVTEEIRKRHPNVAYLHFIEPRFNDFQVKDVAEEENLDFVRDIWSPRPLIVSGGHTAETAAETADKHENTIVSFGRHFTSNPDLIRRFKESIPLTPYQRELFYIPNGGAQGFTDFPVASELKN
ncbi:hypothetical protein JCM8097_007205 [Rhodosporidiobolus ruineniae]